jgi:hypothetical protein
MSEKKQRNAFWIRLYRRAGICLSVIFGAVGLIFLILPDQTLSFFNRLSPPLGFTEAPVHGMGFFLILAVGYMYLVTLLAGLMAKHPENRYFPMLLIHGKCASSVLSFAFFALHGPFLIYAANGVIDGSIALAVWILYRNTRTQVG